MFHGNVPSIWNPHWFKSPASLTIEIEENEVSLSIPFLPVLFLSNVQCVFQMIKSDILWIECKIIINHVIFFLLFDYHKESQNSKMFWYKIFNRVHSHMCGIVKCLNDKWRHNSHNSLKLSFTNIWGLRSNFVDCESFLE